MNQDSDSIDNSEKEDNNEEDSNSDLSSDASNRSLSTLSVIRSVLAGLIGVQSQKNRETDFSKGRPSDYIIYGILAVISLMIIMGVIVNSVISSSGQ